MLAFWICCCVPLMQTFRSAYWALAGNPHKSVLSAVGIASGNTLLRFCWTLAVLEQAGSEAFQIPWRALSHMRPNEIGTLATEATAYCQVCQTSQATAFPDELRQSLISKWQQPSERPLTATSAGCRGASTYRSRTPDNCQAPGSV